MLWVDMATVATQTAGERDVSAMTDNLTSQLNLLMSELNNVNELTGDRQSRLDALERTVDSTGVAVSDMDSVIDSMERELERARTELSELETVHKQLLEEQDKLDEAGHRLYQRVSVQDQYLQQVRAADKQQDTDLTRARFLRDEMRDELFKKEEELSIARGRLDEQNIEFFKEFEGLKADVRRHRKEAHPLLQELDDCDKLTLTRINHFLKSDNISPSDMDKAERLKKFVEYISRYRKVFDEVGDLEFEVRNAERALEFSQSQVKSKLTKMESLEKELNDIVGVFGECEGNYLKSAPRCVDLAHNTEIKQEMETACWSEDEDETVGVDEFQHVGGLGLHRCVKVTDIRVEFEEKGEEEKETTVEELQEEHRQEEQVEDEEEKKDFEDEEEVRDKGTTEEQTFVKIDMKKALAEKAARAQALDNERASSSTRSTAGPAMEGVTATEKQISSVTHRGDLSLSRDSRSSFVKPTHRTELRATGSSAMYKPTASGRKQKK